MPVSDRAAPQVSICVPAYNRPGELRAAVASVLEQTEADLEVVITDDSDRSQGEWVEQLGDPRVRYAWNPRRLGMAGNWERALSLARGRFVGLLMDDDRLLPEYLEACLDAFRREPEVGLVFTNHYFDDGRRLRQRPTLLGEGTYRDFLPLLLEVKPVAVSATLMRRQVRDDVLPLPDLQTADMIVHVRAAQAGWPFHYVDRPLMVYRMHPAQLSAAPAFRDQEVGLWRSFSFAPDSEPERLRRRRLAAALIASAAAEMQRGRYQRARRRVEEAAALGVPVAELGRRARLISAISRSRLAMRSASAAFRAARRLAPR